MNTAWFKRCIKSKDNVYREFNILGVRPKEDGKSSNELLSVFGVVPAWELDLNSKNQILLTFVIYTQKRASLI